MSSSRDNNALCLPCPVTGGVSTKMTRESFARACKLARQAVQYSIYGRRKRNDNKILRERCAGCRGKRWPQELQITTVEDIMSQYTCDLCGKKSSAKKPRKSLGMSLCYTCAGIVAGLGHMKELATALKKTGKTDELLKALGVEEKRYEDLEVVAMDAIEILAKALPPVPTNIDDTMSAYEVATIAEEVALYIQEQQEKIIRLNNTDDNRAYQLEMENNRLRRENEYLAQRKHREPLDSALLEWARKRYEAGEIKLKVTVEAADENN